MKRLRRRYDCPVELALDLLDGKWKTVILARLKERPLRYGELRRAIPLLSDKMLTQRLRELQAQGWIEHRDGAYAMAPRTERLRPILQALYEWGEQEAAELDVAIRAA